VLARKPTSAGISRILPLLLAACVSPAFAETLRYGLEVPDGQSVTYTLELDVRHPGTLSVRAEWPGNRILSLKLDPPDRPYGTLRHSGPSPQVLETAIRPGDADIGIWQLQIHSLAAGGGGEGTLVIELPDSESLPRERAAAEPPEPEQPDPDPWMKPRALPARVPTDWLPFLDAAERFRAEVAGETTETPVDVCRWQSPLMRYLADRRDQLLDGTSQPEQTTGKLLARIASAIETVEQMRISDDPMLNGPPPEDPALRNAWLKLRTTKVQPVENELDFILGLVQRGHAPELEAEDWPIRLVSCLTACERYFEQLARVGEDRAGNRDLALAQWPHLLTAAEALSALADLAPAERASQ